MTATTDPKDDILIIGGGPAGSTAASFLTMQGYRVRLFEKERFPRVHVGESLLPFCYDIFRDLGVLEQMKRSFVRKPGVRFVSADGSAATTWCFDRVIHDESYRSFQVARDRFDQMLLENARRHGATALEETRVTDVDLESRADEVRLTAVGPDGAERQFGGRFLLDASGRDTFIGTQMRSRKANPELDRTALWSHYTGVALRGGLEEGLSVIVYLGGDKKGWAWVFPLGTDHVTVGIATDHAFIRSEKKRLKGDFGSDWMLALFEQEIGRSPFISELLEGAERSMQLHVNGNYSYSVDTKYGSNFALIGDAGRFIDPIFSSGVFLSMKGARMVSDAVGEMLGNGGSRDLAPLDAAYRSLDGGYRFVYRMIRLFYNPHASSWAEIPDLDRDSKAEYERHSRAMAAGHFMLAGDFFERQERYNEMFDLLEQPRDFGRYKNLVIEEWSGETSCRKQPPEENFPLPRPATAATGGEAGS